MSFKERYGDKTSLTGLLMAIIFFVMFIWISSSSTFDLSSFGKFSSDFTKSPLNADLSASQFLWTNRTIDVIIQAILVFGAAACCIAMLRPEKVSKGT